MKREDCIGLDGYCIVIKQCFGSGSFCPDPDRQKNLDLIRKIRIGVRVKKGLKTVSTIFFKIILSFGLLALSFFCQVPLNLIKEYHLLCTYTSLIC